MFVMVCATNLYTSYLIQVKNTDYHPQNVAGLYTSVLFCLYSDVI